MSKKKLIAILAGAGVALVGIGGIVYAVYNRKFDCLKF